MVITVNGQSRDVAEEATIAGLLDDLSLTGKPVAVEVNLELVPRQRHAGHRWPRVIAWRSSRWLVEDNPCRR